MPMQSTVRTAVLRILYVQYSLVILTQLGVVLQQREGSIPFQLSMQTYKLLWSGESQFIVMNRWLARSSS